VNETTTTGTAIEWVPLTSLRLPKCKEDFDRTNRVAAERFALGSVRRPTASSGTSGPAAAPLPRIETLTYSIETHGMWVPLLVRKDKMTVVDGVSRLIVLRWFKETKKLPADQLVPVIWFDFGGHDGSATLKDLRAQVVAIKARLVSECTPYTDRMTAHGFRQGDTVEALAKDMSWTVDDVRAALARVGDGQVSPLIPALRHVSPKLVPAPVGSDATMRERLMGRATAKVYKQNANRELYRASYPDRLKAFKMAKQAKREYGEQGREVGGVAGSAATTAWRFEQDSPGN
jgi:hypothetical protein